MPRESSSELHGHGAAPVSNSPGYTDKYGLSRRSLVNHDRRKVLFVVNDAGFFRSHRLRLAQEALRRGFEPVVACGESTGEDALEAFGIRCLVFELSRSGLNPLRDLKTFFALLRIYRDEAPDIVHHVALKSVVIGRLAARLSRVQHVVNALTGLGHLFTIDEFKNRLLRLVLSPLLRLALRRQGTRSGLVNTGRPSLTL